jgi:hypothetical protein
MTNEMNADCCDSSASSAALRALREKNGTHRFLFTQKKLPSTIIQIVLFQPLKNQVNGLQD